MQISAEDRAAMEDAFSRLLADQADEAAVRVAMETDAGFDRALWQAMAQMGILGTMAPEASGGIGGGPEEIAALLTHSGASLLGAPLVNSAIHAVAVLSQATDSELREELLAAAATGEKVLAVADGAVRTGVAGEGCAVFAKPGQGNAFLLNGKCEFVVHAQNADCLLVVAETAAGVALFAVGRDANGLSVEALAANDPILRIGHLTFVDTLAQEIAGVSTPELAAALKLVQLAIAAEQAGGTRRIFEITLSYLKERYQFGRPIGSFQALKHIAADLLLDVEAATTAVQHAARALAAGADEADQLLHLACFTCADAYRNVSAEAIQLHGGIAYTWEHVAHLYWRRARSSAWLFGDSDMHREAYLRTIEAAA